MRRIIDSDILTLFFEGNAAIIHKMNQFAQGELGLTIVTVDEDLVGWHTELHKRQNKKPERQSLIWAKYAKSIRIYSLFEIYTYTAQAMERYQQLHAMGLNIGGNDLRIASIALEWQARLVTRNQQHFNRVPGLSIETWLDS